MFEGLEFGDGKGCFTEFEELEKSASVY